MAAYKKFPPKGYRSTDYPLPHNFSFRFGMGLESGVKDSTIVPLIRSSEACASPDTIEVNPRNAAFAEETGATCHPMSIIPKINLTWSAYLSKAAFGTDVVRYLKLNVMPIYISFLSSLDASDEKSGDDIETILELGHATDNKDTFPLYAGGKLPTAGSVALSTVNDADEALADYALTTTAVYEHVAFNKELFYDALQYYTNGGMLRKVTGGMRTHIVHYEKPFMYHSNNFTYPTVKRMNAYTFCGLLFNLPQASDEDQLMLSSETTDIGHLVVVGKVRYDEWHPDFDQTIT